MTKEQYDRATKLFELLNFYENDLVSFIAVKGDFWSVVMNGKSGGNYYVFGDSSRLKYERDMFLKSYQASLEQEIDKLKLELENL